MSIELGVVPSSDDFSLQEDLVVPMRESLELPGTHFNSDGSIFPIAKNASNPSSEISDYLERKFD